MKQLFYIFIIASLIASSCTSKEEKERQQREKARIERERYVNDSTQAAIERETREYKRHQELQQELRQDSINKAEHINEIRNSIKITSYYLTSPNSANGVSTYFYYKNLSDKVIKYLVWTGYPINAVNDIVSCEIRGNSSFSGKDTGPVKKGGTGGGYWDCAWYNSTAKKLILEKIDIEYMDGSTLCIKGDDLYLIGKKKTSKYP